MRVEQKTSSLPLEKSRVVGKYVIVGRFLGSFRSRYDIRETNETATL